jgi:N-acetylmuramoyl-L-alanine amidase
MAGIRLKKVCLLICTALAVIAGLLCTQDFAFASGKTAIITGKAVNIRSGPGTGYSKLKTVYQGERFDVLDQKKDWYKVKLSSKSSGWTIKTYVSITVQSGSAVSKPESNTIQAGTAQINMDGVNIRKGPGTNFGKLAKVNKGQGLTIIKEKNGWYNIKLSSGKTGWVIKNRVTMKITVPVKKPILINTKPPVNGQKLPEVVEGISGYSLAITEKIVNVRSGAGTGFSILTKVKSGDTFKVILKNGEWYMVDLPAEKHGWIAGWVAEVRQQSLASRNDSGDRGTEEPADNNQTPVEEKPVTPPPGGVNVPVIAKLTGLEMVTDVYGKESVVIRCYEPVKYKLESLKGPNRIVIDINNCDVNGFSDAATGGMLVSGLRVAQYSLTPMIVRVVLDLNRTVSYLPMVMDNGKRLNITLSEPSIQGKVIAIDAGHGGYDPGAVGITGLYEKSFNKETVQLLKDKLTALGATVVLTREGDNFVSLSGRAAAANAVYADVFVSIHANSSEKSSVYGTSTYYYAPGSTNSLAIQQELRKGLAAVIEEHLLSTLGTADKGVQQDNFAVLRETKMPSALVESAFLSNYGDEARLKDSGFREKVAQAVADGLVEYFAGE